MCNVAYSTLCDGKDEGEVEKLDVAIGLAYDPAEEALTALREHQEQAGMEFADPDAPVAAPDSDGTERWMVTGEEFR